MAENPLIFISATSSDLASARELAARVLTTLGYQPVWQDIAATEGGHLLKVLRQRIDSCQAVLQLVGWRYGAEPPAPDPVRGRISYTQYEAIYAESVGQQVIYIFLGENFPTDPCEPETLDKVENQLAYRAGIKARGLLRYTVDAPHNLEIRLLYLRNDLQKLREDFARARHRLWVVAAVALIMLSGIGYGTWRLLGSSGRQEHALGVIQVAQKVAQGSLDTIDSTTQKADATVNDIDATGKKETSSDPRKELANMGISWTLENFQEVTRNGDLRSIHLFLTGGYSPMQTDSSAANYVLESAITGRVQNFKEVVDEFRKNGLDWTTPFDPAEKMDIYEGFKTMQDKLYDCAAFRQNAAAVRVLKEAGADPTAVLAAFQAHIDEDKKDLEAFKQQLVQERQQFGYVVTSSDNAMPMQMSLSEYTTWRNFILQNLGRALQK